MKPVVKCPDCGAVRPASPKENRPSRRCDICRELISERVQEYGFRMSADLNGACMRERLRVGFSMIEGSPILW